MKNPQQHVRSMMPSSNTHSDGYTNNNNNSTNPGEKHRDVHASIYEAKHIMYQTKLVISLKFQAKATIYHGHV